MQQNVKADPKPSYAGNSQAKGQTPCQ
jgi:hypothetical protein